MVVYKPEDLWQITRFFGDDEYLHQVIEKSIRAMMDLHSKKLSIEFIHRPSREWTSLIAGSSFDIDISLYTKYGKPICCHSFKDCQIIYRDFFRRKDTTWCVFSFSRLERYGVDER